MLLEFGDFCIEKPVPSLSCLSFLGQFPLRPGTQLSFWVLTGAWLPPLPSPGDSSPLAAEWQRQHESSGKWGKEELTKDAEVAAGIAASMASPTPGLTTPSDPTAPELEGNGSLASRSCSDLAGCVAPGRWCTPSVALPLSPAKGDNTPTSSGHLGGHPGEPPAWD